MTCCLCGNKDSFTGEHKVKSSVLARVFGQTKLSIVSAGYHELERKFPQSVGSKQFRFASRICETCNTSRTQSADKEYDFFSQAAHSRFTSNEGNTPITELERYANGTPEYLNLCRYFAKILCCQLADAYAPSACRLSRFAIGASSQNPIALKVQKDPLYEELQKHIDNLPFVAHGGLSFYWKKSTQDLTGFQSTLSIGGLQFVFSMRLTREEIMELKCEYPEFVSRCRSKLQPQRAASDI